MQVCRKCINRSASSLSVDLNVTGHSKTNKQVGLEVLMAARMKMAVFWVVAPRSLVEVYQRFRGACCLHHQGIDPDSSLRLVTLMMEAAGTSETSVNFYQTAQHINPKYSHLQTSKHF
jgi:hypothetical protein